ncbi:hypothetical protein SAMN05428974_0713 [Sphingopyxis sp. YR583]|jgi:hypothetical protein|uniref:hypothetical protein n=1 Tax=Sphingopyxis sp. YR583 TaxID=1881047 RepID=UPI0008A7D325|nr:hypothetical protein [Sphingopyxis sp. YR583]SEH13249.1 hypothetical protein SAMN05428974_0713 [Sphingopyxis sp. YR583]
MDRRTLLTSIAGTAAAGACTAKGAGSESAGRPTLTIDAVGAGRWRVRSWQWRANAWHPLIAWATRSDAGIEVSGAIEAADRAKVLARLGV